MLGVSFSECSSSLSSATAFEEVSENDMTKPKKWHMDLENGEVILKYDSVTPVGKPNAALPLGAVESVTPYDPSQADPKGKLPKDRTVKVNSFHC